MMKYFVSLLVLITVGHQVFAQAPQKFSYQAVIRNENNTLVCGIVGVRVSILQGDANGEMVYQETHTVETNTNGLMTLEIGDGTVVSGDFSAIDWADGPYFLKVETDPTGGSNYTIESVQQLLSVPYALYAGAAANAFSGDYNDLTHQPEIPTVPTNVSAFANDAHYITEAQLQGILNGIYHTIDSLQAVIDSLSHTPMDTQSTVTPTDTQMIATVPAAQLINHQDDYLVAPITGGLHIRFDSTGITHVELESVDGYAIAGTAAFVNHDSMVSVSAISDTQSIITFSAPEGSFFAADSDYYITTFPCDVYGGYRLSIFKDGLVAHYFGVHQVFESGQFIDPLDLEEDELDFVDPAAPLVEDERPQLNAATQIALRNYRLNPSEENRLALMEQMGIRYDKVVARKKAKLRQLEREAHHQYLIDEMQSIVDEMVQNREERLEQQFLRLVDGRQDDNPNDAWLVLRGIQEGNAYIGYAPVTNAEYTVFQTSFSYPSGQGQYPVVNITYAEAVAYCNWLSANDSLHDYRLPSEWEWVMAAGHMPKDVGMNSNHVESGITAVDAYAQTTGACGGIDFWGNCWEWTSTQNDSGWYIVKGGSWDSTRDECRTEYSEAVRNGSLGYPNVGLRVVRVDE